MTVKGITFVVSVTRTQANSERYFLSPQYLLNPKSIRQGQAAIKCVAAGFPENRSLPTPNHKKIGRTSQLYPVK